MFRDYIKYSTGIHTKHLQYDPTLAITEAVTNAMVHAHNFNGEPVRVILQIKHPVTPLPSQPKVLTIKVWDSGTGFPEDIHERVDRQIRKVQQLDHEFDQIKAKIESHESALQAHRAELRTVEEDDTKADAKKERIMVSV